MQNHYFFLTLQNDNWKWNMQPFSNFPQINLTDFVDATCNEKQHAILVKNRSIWFYRHGKWICHALWWNSNKSYLLIDNVISNQLLFFFTYLYYLGESPSSSASDIDKLTNQVTAEKAILSKCIGSHVAGNHHVARNRPKILRLLDFVS